MARPRLLVSSSERLARLDALLVAAGATRGDVAWLDDALELFSIDVADGAVLVADLEATPIADAGLLRRWLDGEPGARILWIGDDPGAIAAFAAAGAPGEAWPWPLDLDQLGRLADGTFDIAAATRPSDERPPPPPEDEALDAPPSPQASPAEAESPNGAEATDTELTRIERILGGEEAESPQSSDDGSNEESMPPPAPEPAPRPSDDSPYDEPRMAFLAASRPAPRPPRTEPSVAAAPTVEAALDPAPAPLPANELEPPAADPLSLDPLASDEPLLTEEEIEAFFSLDVPEAFDEPAVAADEPPTIDGGPTAPELEEPAADPEVHAADAAALRPAWLKDQVSDLADIVQTLDLRARANHSHLGIDDELARLRQFTRTIGYVASPPARGEQEFDLAVLVEEQLGALAGHEPDAPRLLFRRSAEGTSIEADKLLVTMALDALLHTAVRCAGPGDVVRVSVETEDRRAPVVRVRFPSGPLRDVPPSDVLQPYALKGLLPTVGPNALAAAGAIAVGQGGDLVLVEESPDVRVFEVSFSDAPAS